MEPYTENQIWFCENLTTGYKTRINGLLAEVLSKYPLDYKLSMAKEQSNDT